MNTRSLRILEYNKIIDALVEYAGSPNGKECCRNLQPSTDIREIIELQEQTRDALRRIYQHGSLSFRGITDINLSLMRLEVEAALSTSELLAIARLLEVTLTVRQYGVNEEVEHEPDSLDASFLDLMPLESITREIRRCILSEDIIADDASVELRSIRKSIKFTNDKIHSQLTSIVNSHSNQTLLQDNLITMRNGRYCIPVKQEYRSSFPGMIHDQSSSGSTLFIEPMTIVNLNNELKELANKEQMEIERILASLSEQVRYDSDNIRYNLTLLTKLDFIFARAAYAKSYQGSEPIFNTDGFINIKQGRHPLLDRHKVVPIDIHLGDTYNMLVITGPNTGGKTVSLKTVGLFSLMGQSGLHIPAFDGSGLCVFEDVFADIGDEQSIEQSLSTFSSHMSNIVSIVQNATPNTLVLFDELGGGTDPTEGAALAIAILNHLLRQNIRCMATTHYSELKTFALSTPEIENASCEFDVASLRPTYKLMIGIPGKSNAFAISQKLGLPDYIIEEAKTQIDASSLDFEALISDLENSRKKVLEEQAIVEQYRKEVEALKLKLETKQESIEQQRSKLLQDAREEAKEMLEEAKEMADQAIRKYQKWERNPAKADNKAMEAERSKLRNKMKGMDSSTSINKAKRSSNHKPEDFKIGDTVHILSMGTNGSVLTLPNAKNELSVQIGILRSQVSIKDLVIVDTPVITGTNLQKTASGKVNLTRSISIKPEINVIGKKVDEALAEIDKYLDDACLSHLHQVTIIHGKGTGALRNAIRNYLKKQSYVKDFRNGEFGEGDMGVTIVEFK